MSFPDRLARIRAASQSAAASFAAAPERVTTYELPHGRTVVVREALNRDDYAVVGGRIVRRAPMSPWAQRALEGKLPTQREVPLED